MNKIITVRDLGVVPYRDAWGLQERLREERVAGKIGDQLLILTHPPVFTLGQRDCDEDFRTKQEYIRSLGIDIVKTNRGGRITYHGPGQLVGYFICNLESLGCGIKDFVGAIEEICIELLADFGIEAGRDAANPGIWIGKNKIAAIGLNVTHGVTEHGFALNVDCNLAAYKHIVACGIQGRGVTSMAMEMKTPPNLDEVKAGIIKYTAHVLGHEVRREIPNPKKKIPNKQQKAK